MTSDSTSVRRLLVLSPNWLGDAVMALPAIADVRRRFSNARLIVAARRSVADLFTMVPGVDQVVTLEWTGKLQQRRALRHDSAALEALDADAAILLPNAFSAAWLVKRAGIGERWGYAADFRRPLLSRAVSRPRHSMHQAEYYQHLVRQLGMDSGPLEPGCARPDDVIVGARMLLNSRNWKSSRPFIAIAPGAAYGTAKRWLPEHYATLVSNLVESGAQCVLVGSRGDIETTKWIQRLVPDKQRRDVLDLTGVTSPVAPGRADARSPRLSSRTTREPCTSPRRWEPGRPRSSGRRAKRDAPLPRRARRAEVLIHDVWCRPCMLRECPIDHRCMKGTVTRARGGVRALEAAVECRAMSRRLCFSIVTGRSSRSAATSNGSRARRCFRGPVTRCGCSSAPDIATVVDHQQCGDCAAASSTRHSSTRCIRRSTRAWLSVARGIDRYYYCPHIPKAHDRAISTGVRLPETGARA